MWMLTDERKNDLLRQRDMKLSELEALRKKSIREMWIDDLEKFEQKLDFLEEKERQDEAGSTRKEKDTAAKKGVCALFISFLLNI